MSDSRNWSSFEEKPNASTKSNEEASKQAKDGKSVAKKPFDFNALRQRLIFGGLVGVSTGATFGFS